MNSIALFLGLCIPFRLAIAWGTTKIPLDYLKYLGIILLLVALGFLYLYFSNSRLQAPEAGGSTWWASYRLLIGMLWLTASIYAFTGRNDMIWKPLIIDVLLGLVIFYYKHFV